MGWQDAPVVKKAPASWRDAPVVSRSTGGGDPGKPRGVLATAARNVDAAVRGAADFVTLGFADEIAAAGDAAIQGITDRDTTFGERYRRNHAEQETRDRADGRDAPIARGAGQTVGFVGTLGLGVATGAGKLLAPAAKSGALRVAETVGRNAFAGAVFGGAQAAGDAGPDAADKIASAPSGAGVGAVVGAASVPAGWIAEKAIGAGARGVRRLVRGKPDLEERALNAFVDRARPDDEALAAMRQRAENHWVNGADDVALVDAMDDSQRGIVAAAAARNTPARATARDFSDRRAADLQGQVSRLARREISDAPPPNVDELRDRFSDDLFEITGVDPTFVAGDFASRARQLREVARPLYDSAYEAGPVSSSVLEDLARRPSIKSAIARAYRIAREEGRDPEALGLTEMLLTAERAGPAGNAPVDPLIRETLDMIRADKAERLSRGPTLAQFLAGRGGLRDLEGELSSMDAQLWHRAKPFQRRLVNPQGRSLEDSAQAAYEAGYFPDIPPPTMEGAANTQVVTRDMLLDAIRDELSGKVRFARPVSARGERLGQIADVEERIGRAGIDGRTATPQQVANEFAEDDAWRSSVYEGSPAPESELLETVQPTAQTWDYVKRGLDDILETYRDKTTGRLQLDEGGRAVLGTLNAFRQELVDRNPLYGQALAAGGEPLRLEQAYRHAGRLMSARVPERQFHEWFGKLSPSEVEGARAGWLNSVFEGIRNGKLNTRDMQTPAYVGKLERLFGREQAQQIRERLGNIDAARLGDDFTSADAREFADAAAGMSEGQLETLRAASARAIERMAGKQGSAPGVARDLALGREMRTKTEALVPGRADRIAAAADSARTLARNAAEIDPYKGSKTDVSGRNAEAAGAVKDLVGVATGGWSGALNYALTRLKTAGMSDAEAQALVDLAVNPAMTERALKLLEGKMRPNDAQGLIKMIRTASDRNAGGQAGASRGGGGGAWPAGAMLQDATGAYYDAAGNIIR